MRPGTRVKSKEPLFKANILVGEDMRPETDGKITIIGLYPDNTVVALLGADQPDPTSERPLVFPSLTILINITGVAGTRKLAIRPLDGIGEFEGIPEEVEFEAGNSRSIILKLQPCVVNSLGIKRFSVHVDNDSQVVAFEVRGRRAQRMQLAASTIGVPIRRSRPKR